MKFDTSMTEFRCRLLLETTFEADNMIEGRNIAYSEFAHAIVDEGLDPEQVETWLEDCGPSCSEDKEACKGTIGGECDCEDCWQCCGESHLVKLANLGGFGPGAIRWRF